MRIISGKKKGLNLTAIKGDWIRPTTDKVRGAIFSSVLNYISDEGVFVDCFAGSGAMSIEALSRGFEHAYLFDNNKKSIQIIKENLKKANYLKETTVLLSSAIKGLRFLKDNNIKADFFFMDPPYKKFEIIFELLEYISNNSLLSPEGVIVLEHDRNDIINGTINNFLILKEKTYGSTTITILKINEKE